MRYEAVHLYANVAAGEIIIVEAMYGDTIHRDAKCVHSIGRYQIGVPDGCRLRQVIQAAYDSVQDVAGKPIWRRQ